MDGFASAWVVAWFFGKGDGAAAGRRRHGGPRGAGEGAQRDSRAPAAGGTIRVYTSGNELAVAINRG